MNDISEALGQSSFTCVAWASSHWSNILAGTMFTLQGVYLVLKIVEIIQKRRNKDG